MNNPWRLLMIAALSLCLTGAGSFLILSSISMADGWRLTVFRQGLAEISGMVLDADGTIFISLEGRAGRGQLLSLRDNQQSLLVDALNKPDGLAIFQGVPVFTQEDGKRAVIEYRDGESVALFTALNAEGIDTAINGDIYIVEDRKDGRLLKYDRQLESVTVLVSGLEEAEGVCVMGNGVVYFSEKAQGRIYRLQSGITELFLDDLTNPGYLYCDAEEQGLWVTEDRTNFGRLLHITDQGKKIEVIGKRLHSPQSIAFYQQGDILVAEQGRNRIVRFSRK